MAEGNLDGRNRDLLIRLEQQLKDANQNHSQFSTDLREIFHRLERDSKSVMTVEGMLKSQIDISKVKWDELEKKLTDILKRLDETEDRTETDASKLAEEKSQREKDWIALKSSVKTVAWIFGVLASLATIISCVVAFLTLTQG